MGQKVLSAKFSVLSKKTYLELFDCIRSNWVTGLIVISAFALYMLVVFPSGSRYCINSRECGIFFWGAHEHDAIWHLALVAGAFKSYPFVLPIYLGEQLGGYNYLFDFLIFLLTKTGLSASWLYFKILPTLWFCVFVFVLYRLFRNISNYLYAGDSDFLSTRKTFVNLGFLISFFAGSFGYVFTFFHERSIQNSASLFPMQSAMAMINPQFVWSLVFMVVLIDLFITFLDVKTISVKEGLVVGISVFVMIGLKAYSIGFLIFYFLFTTLFFLKESKYKSLFLFATSFGLGVFFVFITFYFNLQKSSDVFLLKPFALFKSVFSDSRYLNMSELGVVWDTLEAGAKPSLKLLLVQICAFLIYFLFSVGIRILGFWGALVSMYRFSQSKVRRIDQLCIFFTLAVIFCTLPTVLLIQRGEWWNTVQFFYYAIFLMNFLFLITFFEWLGKMKGFTKHLTLFGLFLIFIPIQLDTARVFSSLNRASFIPDDEIKALNFLKNQDDGVVLTQPYYAKNTDDYMTGAKYGDRKIPLPDLIDTAYVTAYSGKTTYFSNENQLKLLNVASYNDRKMKLFDENCDAINWSKIDYVYLRSTHRLQNLSQCSVRKMYSQIYSNNNIEIWSKR